MSRIEASFARLASAHRKALIPYVTAGHPGREITVPLMHAMVASGADAIELGVPFSDPMADGPVIQRANEAALARGIGLRDVLAMVREFRHTDDLTPVVLMGYANPVERMGVGLFLDEALSAGVDGLIVVDYPPEESEDFTAAARARGIDMVFLLAPTSGDDRIEQVARLASGYVYYVSLKGITGAGNLDTAEVAQRVDRIKRSTSLPVGVGFGIRDAATAKAIATHADAVIIGSRMIQLLEDGEPAGAPARAAAFIAEVRAALDELKPAAAAAATA
ncbi:MAG: tryptophan synthase subunit alpha [Gammaproteobacteria bacterium]